MATAIKKLMNDPKAQAAIRSRAAGIARKKIDEATKAARAKFRAAAPVIKRDIVQAQLVPAAVGAGGAVAADMLFNRFGKKLSGGAKGDVLKVAAAVGLGYVGGKVIKSPHVGNAALGVATVGLYKLLTRMTNRAKVGTLSGLLAEDHDADLAGYPEPIGMLGYAEVPALELPAGDLSGTFAAPAYTPEEIG